MTVKPPQLILNGIVIISRDDGFINATQLCKAGGKKFNHWYKTETVKKLIYIHWRRKILVLKWLKQPLDDTGVLGFILICL